MGQLIRSRLTLMATCTSFTTFRFGFEELVMINIALLMQYDSIRQILALRRRQSKNALMMLSLSQGVPVLLMGDELGRTQLGNNDAYCHFANTAMAPPADIWEPGQ